MTVWLARIPAGDTQFSEELLINGNCDAHKASHSQQYFINVDVDNGQ